MLGIANGMLHHQWKPKIDGRVYPHTGETVRRHTDNREGRAVELDRLAYDPRGSTEAPLPETVADDGDRVSVDNPVIFGSEQAAEFGIDSQRREVFAGYELARRRRGLSLAGRERVQRRDPAHGEERIRGRRHFPESLKQGIGILLGPRHCPIRVDQRQFARPCDR